ncbi:MAG: PqqD family peptide modification chaperone [Blastocatellia bacterium]
MKTRPELQMPDRRNKGLVVKELQNELLIYDLDRNKAHCLNQACSLIWNHCDGKATVAEVVSLLEKESGSVVDETVVLYALSQLGTAHLLSDNRKTTAQTKRVTRREVMGRIGVAAVVSLPLITSILAPTAQAQASCLANGSLCTTDAQCCSGRCQMTGQSLVCAG